MGGLPHRHRIEYIRKEPIIFEFSEIIGFLRLTIT
jgi:hypothetical protein